MNTALWIAAGILAVLFAAAGGAKLAMQRELLASRMAWTNDATDVQVKLLGALEVAGAIGVVLPAIVDIAPALVPIAAIGLALTMVGAIVVHVRRNEPIAAVAPPVVLLGLCVFVAVGRFGSHAF